MKSIVFILVYILAFSVLLINSEIEFKLNGVRQLMYGQGIEKTFSNISVKGISFDEELCQLQTTYLINQIQSSSIWALQSECTKSEYFKTKLKTLIIFI